ncbi:MAG: hypothetical protein ACOYZ6_14390 [Chloroflexota bacterium]
MKQNDGIFPFDLSRSELHWLAGAFGIASLPLPEAAPAGLSPSQLEALQKDGHASLLTRGLIRPSPGFGWQVERLPAALVQWIASAPSLLRLEHIPKEGTPRHVHFFTQGDQGLSLEMDGDTAYFVIYETLSLLHDATLRWLSLPAKSKATPSSYTIPQPLTFIPAAWKDLQLAARILGERGVNPKVIKSTLAWVSVIHWVTAFSVAKLEKRGNSVLNQYVICSDGKLSWGGEGKEINVSFVPMTAKEMSAKIAEMLNRFGRLA